MSVGQLQKYLYQHENCMTNPVFRHVRKTAKKRLLVRHICLSVRPSTWNNWAAAGRIFMKLDISIFFENLPK
jgi:hypothetical protein